MLRTLTLALAAASLGLTMLAPTAANADWRKECRYDHHGRYHCKWVWHKDHHHGHNHHGHHGYNNHGNTGGGY